MTSSVAPSSGDEFRVNNFDLIRLFAALQVASIHVLANFKPDGLAVAIVAAGLRLFPGVPIFFVISGFLISRSFERSPSVRDYYRNRCLRIYPALWVCLVVSAGVIAFKMHTPAEVAAVVSGEWLRWWAAQMTLFQQYAPDFLHGLRLNGSLWTIPVELQFYLLIPLMYACFRLRTRRGDIALLTVMVVSVGVHWLLVHAAPQSVLAQNQFLLDSILPYLWMFLTGVLIQRNWSVLRGWFVERAHWWLSGYLLVFGLLRAFAKIGPGSADINLLYMLPLAAVTVSCAMSARSLATRILGHNDFSYGTYIYHMLVVAVMLQLGTPLNIAFAILAVAISAGVGALSWFCVEKPFLRQKHGALRSLPAAPRRIADQPLPDGVHERVG